MTMAKAKYPWEEIRQKYIEGIPGHDGSVTWPSYRELFEAYRPDGPRYGTIRTRAGKEKWSKLRTEFKDTSDTLYRQKIVQERANLRVKQATQLDNLAVSISRDGLLNLHQSQIKLHARNDVIHAQINKAKEAEDYDRASELAERLEPMTYRDAAEMGRATDSLFKTARLAMGEPTEHKVSEISGKDGGPVEVSSVVEMITIAREAEDPDPDVS